MLWPDHFRKLGTGGARFDARVKSALSGEASKSPVFAQGLLQPDMIDWALSYFLDDVNPIPNPFHTTLLGTLGPLFPNLLGPPAGLAGES